MPEDKKPKSADLRQILLDRKMNVGNVLRPVRDYYNKGRAGIPVQGEDLPFTAPPSWFQPDPLTVGEPGFAIAAKKLLDLDPITKSQVRSVTQGPTRASMQEMISSGLPADRFSGTTLQGIYDLHNKDVGVNPGMSDGETLRTLAHELAHASAYGEEGAQGVEGLVAPSDDEEAVPMESLLQAMVKKFKDAGIKAELK